VTSIKMLGVTVTNNLSVSEHVCDVIGKCAQSLVLAARPETATPVRHNGMSDDSLRHVRVPVILTHSIWLLMNIY